MVARCSVGEIDIGQTLVAHGLAFAHAQYSQDYVAVEVGSMRSKQGIHAYQLVRLADFRAAKVAPKSSRPKQMSKLCPPGCIIKGNISAKGGRIFHVEGQRDYLTTSIRRENGERWFCSEPDARAAGWRAAKR
jgi:hypothetical protein